MLLQKIHNKTIFFQTSRVVRLLMFFFLIYKNNPLIAQEIYVFGSVKKKNLSIDYNKNTSSKKELFVLNNIKQIIENNITNAISLKNIDLQNIINKNCAIKENELEQIESEAIIHNEDGQNNSTEECIENFNTLRFNQKLNIVHDDIDYLIHLPASKISVKRFEKFSWKEIQRQINIQVKSLHLLIIKLIHHKIFGNKVKIIVIGSEVTKGIPPKGMLDYICGKGLLHYYCLIAKIELVKYNIKLIYLRPGMFQSPLLSNLPEFFLKKYINNNSAKLKTIKTILKIIK
jgi:NADP-dependent 3-hydroxy acid dehydrogenase YdfG